MKLDHPDITDIYRRRLWRHLVVYDLRKHD